MEARVLIEIHQNIFFSCLPGKFKLSLPDVGVEQDWKDDFVALAFLTGFLGPWIWKIRVALLYFCCLFSVALGNWVRTGQSAHNLLGLECPVRFPKSLLDVQPFFCFVFFRCSRHHHFISRFKLGAVDFDKHPFNSGLNVRVSICSESRTCAAVQETLSEKTRSRTQAKPVYIIITCLFA